MRAPKHCGHNDCMTLVVGKTYCPEDTGWKTSPRTASSRRTGTRAWQQQRAKILQRDNHLCQIRGPRCTHTAMEVNHLLPVYLGGDDSMSNGESACHNCHADRTAAQAKAARQ